MSKGCQQGVGGGVVTEPHLSSAVGPPSSVSEAPLPIGPYHHINNPCLLTFPGMMGFQKPSLNPQQFASISKRFVELWKLCSWPPAGIKAQCVAQKIKLWRTATHYACFTGPLKVGSTLEVIYPSPSPMYTDGETEAQKGGERGPGPHFQPSVLQRPWAMLPFAQHPWWRSGRTYLCKLRGLPSPCDSYTKSQSHISLWQLSYYRMFYCGLKHVSFSSVGGFQSKVNFPWLNLFQRCLIITIIVFL